MYHNVPLHRPLSKHYFIHFGVIIYSPFKVSLLLPLLLPTEVVKEVNFEPQSRLGSARPKFYKYPFLTRADNLLRDVADADSLSLFKLS